MSCELVRLRDEIYFRFNKLEKFPYVYVYNLEDRDTFFVNLSSKYYRVLFLPFYYKNLPVIINDYKCKR